MTLRTEADTRARFRELDAVLVAEHNPSRRDAIFAQKCEIALRVQAYDPIASEFGATACDERGHRETWEDAMRLQQEGIQPAEFCKIRAPVRMLHGVADPHPGRLIYEALAPVIPGIRYREFARCGHVPWLDRHARDEFLAALRDVLSE